MRRATDKQSSNVFGDMGFDWSSTIDGISYAQLSEFVGAKAEDLSLRDKGSVRVSAGDLYINPSQRSLLCLLHGFEASFGEVSQFDVHV